MIRMSYKLSMDALLVDNDLVTPRFRGLFTRAEALSNGLSCFC